MYACKKIRIGTRRVLKLARKKSKLTLWQPSLPRRFRRRDRSGSGSRASDPLASRGSFRSHAYTCRLKGCDRNNLDSTTSTAAGQASAVAEWGDRYIRDREAHTQTLITHSVDDIGGCSGVGKFWFLFWFDLIFFFLKRNREKERNRRGCCGWSER